MLTSPRSVSLASALLLGTLFFPSPGRGAEEFRLEARRSSILASVGTAGLLGGFGHEHRIAFTSADGDVRLPDAGPATVNVAVRAADAHETENVSARDRGEIERRLKGPVLETDRYPSIDFSGTASIDPGTLEDGKDVRVDVDGRLALHGVTRPVHVPMTVRIDGDTIHARGTLRIHRRDYRISTRGAAGGLVRVADEVRISLDLVGTKAPAAAPGTDTTPRR